MTWLAKIDVLTYSDFGLHRPFFSNDIYVVLSNYFKWRDLHSTQTNQLNFCFPIKRRWCSFLVLLKCVSFLSKPPEVLALVWWGTFFYEKNHCYIKNKRKKRGFAWIESLHRQFLILVKHVRIIIILDIAVGMIEDICC